MLYISMNVIIHYIELYMYLMLMLLWMSIINWLMDYLMESFMYLSIMEQLSLMISMKLLMLSELMLFIVCFWCYLNMSLMGSMLLLFYFPLLSCYSFSMPFTNLLMLLFSSLPIQCSQMFIKIGILNYSIEGLSQSMCAGFYFIILQMKEFLYSYFNLTDCLIGSIYYFTTGLHGFHVLLGTLFFYIMLFYILLSINIPFMLMELSFSLFLTCYYWHFVDFMWFIVFLLFIM